jgi:hypothetical protein
LLSPRLVGSLEKEGRTNDDDEEEEDDDEEEE